MTMPAECAPMLCQSAKEVPEAHGWTIEPKFDGWRAVALVTDDGVKLYGGRNGNEYTGQLPYVENEIAACVPAGTILDGEIIAPAGWGSVQSVMTSGGAHTPGALSPALNYVVFDVLQIRGADIRRTPLRSRRQILDMIEWQAHVCTVPFGAASKQAHMRFLELGMEGSVCKLESAPYTNGRSTAWVKVKLVETIDCTVVGFKPGEGEFKGMVGALEVQLPDGTRTHASGMTKVERMDMTTRSEAWLNEVVEIEHNGVLTSGKVRHPRFLRKRDDRSPEPPKPTPKRPRAPRSGPWMRNYGAMGAAKAGQSLRELRGGYGDAHQRCVQNGGDLAAHIESCERRCRALGLPV